MNGAGNAYGPDNLNVLDYLNNAGKKTHYYGLMSVKPTPQNPVDRNGMIRADDGTRVKVDPDQPDSQGYLPVIQQAGPYAGYYVSATSKRNRDPGASKSRYEQSYYLDSAAVPYCALSSGIQRKGINGGNFGFAIRLDSFRTASFNILDGEGSTSGTEAYAVGECSYKVFLDIGGVPKRRNDPWPNNNFPTCFVVFPGFNFSPLGRLAFADNANDFAAFIALQGQADAAMRGASGLPKFNDWVARGRTRTPDNYDQISSALMKYVPSIF